MKTDMSLLIYWYIHSICFHFCSFTRPRTICSNSLSFLTDQLLLLSKHLKQLGSRWYQYGHQYIMYIELSIAYFLFCSDSSHCMWYMHAWIWQNLHPKSNVFLCLLKTNSLVRSNVASIHSSGEKLFSRDEAHQRYGWKCWLVSFLKLIFTSTCGDKVEWATMLTKFPPACVHRQMNPVTPDCYIFQGSLTNGVMLTHQTMESWI